MIFKDGAGKDLEVGQQVAYVDQGMMRGEVIEIDDASIMDGAGRRNPRVGVKIWLNFPQAPPQVQAIIVANLAVTEGVLSKIASINDLKRH